MSKNGATIRHYDGDPAWVSIPTGVYLTYQIRLTENPTHKKTIGWVNFQSYTFVEKGRPLPGSVDSIEVEIGATAKETAKNLADASGGVVGVLPCPVGRIVRYRGCHDERLVMLPLQPDGAVYADRCLSGDCMEAKL
jgi:hypothetical protein